MLPIRAQSLCYGTLKARNELAMEPSKQVAMYQRQPTNYQDTEDR